MTERAHYGLRMMTVLAREYGSGRALSLREIADREHLPHPFLEQLSMQLRRAGLVVSARGVKGGYILARHPDAITLYDVVVATDGPVAPVECLAPGYLEGSCPMDACCSSASAWSFLQGEIERALRSRSLGDVAFEAAPSPRAPLTLTALGEDAS